MGIVIHTMLEKLLKISQINNFTTLTLFFLKGEKKNRNNRNIQHREKWQDLIKYCYFIRFLTL